MKRVFTLVLAMGTLTSVFAASAPSDGFKPKAGTAASAIAGNHSFSDHERDEQVGRIRRDYDRRIREVQTSRHLRSNEKERQIRGLEMQRDRQIREVNERYDNSRNRDKRDNNRYDHKDNHKNNHKDYRKDNRSYDDRNDNYGKK